MQLYPLEHLLFLLLLFKSIICLVISCFRLLSTLLICFGVVIYFLKNFLIYYYLLFIYFEGSKIQQNKTGHSQLRQCSEIGTEPHSRPLGQQQQAQQYIWFSSQQLFLQSGRAISKEIPKLQEQNIEQSNTIDQNRAKQR